VAGKQRTDPPKTEEEMRLRATGRSMYRLAKDIQRANWWVGDIVTGRRTLETKDSLVKREIRAQIEAYEKEAGIAVRRWRKEA
jgi:hypothetical protein